MVPSILSEGSSLSPGKGTHNTNSKLPCAPHSSLWHVAGSDSLNCHGRGPVPLSELCSPPATWPSPLLALTRYRSSKGSAAPVRKSKHSTHAPARALLTQSTLTHSAGAVGLCAAAAAAAAAAASRYAPQPRLVCSQPTQTLLPEPPALSPPPLTRRSPQGAARSTREHSSRSHPAPAPPNPSPDPSPSSWQCVTCTEPSACCTPITRPVRLLPLPPAPCCATPAHPNESGMHRRIRARQCRTNPVHNSLPTALSVAEGRATVPGGCL
jgi:hypothetical protein